MSDDSYTEEQARLDVYEFLPKNPNVLNLGKSELIAQTESFKHEKYKKRKTNTDYCRENRTKKPKLDTKKKDPPNHTSLNENYVVPCICLRAI